MHHAAMSGCATAIDISIRMGGTALDLGSARNDHGDSPIMMAATGGHFEFCNFWHGAVAAPDAARAVLEMRNDSNDTALSLASCHGHSHLVEFLLDDCGVGVDLEHVKKCRTSLNRMGTALRSNPALLQQFKDQIEAVAKCVKKLEEKMARRAEEAAQQLMLQEVEESKATKSKQTKKKKSKRKQTATPVGSKLDTSENSFSSKSENNGEKIDSVRLTTLSDGKMAVSVQGPSYTGTTTDRSPLFTTPVRPQSADDMFRQRLQGVSKEVDYDSVMTALCLDVSMLLYSPHGMALNLSPSQLDAIQGILENQIRAVQEARDIQKRVHNTSNTQNIDSS